MKIVLFLGAGFSAPFGYPMMDSFLPHADASPKLNEKDRNFLGKLILAARRANSFLESSPTNLEDILSFSVMGDRLELTEGEAAAGWIQEIIRKIYANPMIIENYWKRYSRFNNFCGLKIEEIKGDLSFVTTNYDLNIESACYRHNLSVYPGFEIKRPEAKETPLFAGEMYSPSGIPLYKLHGSVNWFMVDKNVIVEDRLVALDSFSEEVRSLPWPCVPDHGPPWLSCNNSTFISKI